MVHRVQGSDLTVSLEASLLPTQPRLVTPPQLSLQGAEMSESLPPPAAWEKEGRCSQAVPGGGQTQSSRQGAQLRRVLLSGGRQEPEDAGIAPSKLRMPKDTSDFPLGAWGRGQAGKRSAAEVPGERRIQRGPGRQR